MHVFSSSLFLYFVVLWHTKVHVILDTAYSFDNFYSISDGCRKLLSMCMQSNL